MPAVAFAQTINAAASIETDVDVLPAFLPLDNEPQDPGVGGGDSGGDGDPSGGGDSGGDTTPDPGGGETGGGTDPGAGGGPGGGGDSGGGGTTPDPGGTEYITQVLLKDDEPAIDGQKHFVGEDWDEEYKVIHIEQKGKTVQLNGYYTTNWSYGAVYEAANGTSPLGEVLLDWTSNDSNIATVSPNGLITPKANGTVTITATVRDSALYESEAPYKSVDVVVDGQSGAYVVDVTIIDIDGNDLGSKAGGILEIDEANKFIQFYAIIAWFDADLGIVRFEDTRFEQVSSTITWALGGSQVPATINADTGRLKTTEYSGAALVICTVTGGVAGKSIEDFARIMVDTGSYEYNPSNELTLKVVYEQFPDVVVQEHTYSYAELLGTLSSVSYSYTILGGQHSGYGCVRAQGFLFKDVVDLEGIVLDEVYQFRFGTADGYDNPVTYQLLYDSGPRYYFPNWDIGSRAEAQVVPPILAYRSNMVWGASEVNPAMPLDEGTRFRLLYGPLWEGETNSAYQIYYIDTITLVLAGAPKSDPTSNNDGSNNNGGGGSGDRSVGSGIVGEGAASEEGRRSGVGQEQPNEGDVENDVTNEAGEGAQGNLGTGSGNPKSWHVYEMMSKAQSDVAPLELDGLSSQLLPLSGPFALVCVLTGVGFTYGGFKRRMT
ncbi:MAG: Ig-like domain-containing protein [Coriobacteriales bacterium]|nr:Ig-like domain-containing protein [Coriobacteriales bacterium]